MNNFIKFLLLIIFSFTIGSCGSEEKKEKKKKIQITNTKKKTIKKEMK